MVGTRNVDKSEVISRLLKRHNIPHITLNAKFHRQEGEIIAQAGRLGAVTISTNMAGRGTDILLGGNAEYLARADVAHQELGEAKDDPEAEQRVLAQFRWLSGSPESIPTEMVTKDELNRRLLEKQRQAAGQSWTEEQYKTVEQEARQEATTYVNRIIESYSKYLKHHQKICSEAKEKVLEAGGLHVLGTERHESRRVDNQLRGRAGRQGDPGSSQFFLCLQDDLLRIFIGDRMAALMERLGMEDGVPIEHGMVTRSIENAQKRVEGHNFDLRKNLIEYDDVMNLQRKAIYGLRRKALGDDPMVEEFYDLVERIIRYGVQATCSGRPDTWDVPGLQSRMKDISGIDVTIPEGVGRIEGIELALYEQLERALEKKKEDLGQEVVVVGNQLIPKVAMSATMTVKEPVWRHILRQIYLTEVDNHWRDHLTQMDHLRDGIGLRGYSSRDPKVEYKREGHDLFRSMLREVDHNVFGLFMNIRRISAEEQTREQERRLRAQQEAMLAASRLAQQQSDEVSDSVAPEGSSTRRSASNTSSSSTTAKRMGSKVKKTSKTERRAKRKAR